MNLIDGAVVKAALQICFLCSLFLVLMDKTCHKISAGTQKSGFSLSVLLIWNVSHLLECV